MKKSRFTESQIVGILKEADSGVAVNEIWRKHGISSATYYKWKAKYGGLEVSELVRVKELEAENSQLKRMYANLALENEAIKAVLKTVAPSERRDTVSRLAQDQKLSIRRSCQLMNLSRAAYYREENKLAMRDAPVVEALNAVVAKHGRWGFWKCHDRLKLQGHPWNHKRIWRVYCHMKLNLPRRTKKCLIRPMQPLDAPLWPNEIWSLDFMSDSLYQGRRFRTLNILDEGVREALAIEIDTSLPAQRVVRALQQLEAWRGLPKAIRLDNGPELTSQRLADWCKDKGVELRFIQPGKPNQNAFIERFNRSYRTEVLNHWLFTSLDEVREITHQWLQSYNEERPHDALGSLPPAVSRTIARREKLYF